MKTLERAEGAKKKKYKKKVEKPKWASGQVMREKKGSKPATTATHCPTHDRLLGIHHEIVMSIEENRWYYCVWQLSDYILV